MKKTKLTQNEKDTIEQIANENMRPKTILVIRSKPTLTQVKEGLNLNDGYEFDVNGALPEIADGIAKFAKELPKQGMGETSDKYFITLIHQYFDKL